MVISVHVEKAFDKIHHPFAITILRNPGVQGNIHNLIKNIYKKPPELYSCLSGPQDFQHFCFALLRFSVWLLSFVYRTVSEFSTNLVTENQMSIGLRCSLLLSTSIWTLQVSHFCLLSPVTLPKLCCFLCLLV